MYTDRSVEALKLDYVNVISQRIIKTLLHKRGRNIVATFLSLAQDMRFRNAERASAIRT